MIRPPRAIGLALALTLVLVGAAACGDDGDGGDDGDAKETTTTTEADGGTTTAEDGTTTLPDETTTTAAPPTAGPADLRALLVEPTQIGEGFVLDSALGDGTFSGELCEDVTLDETWAEQASQAVIRGEGRDGALVNQAVLRFAEEGGAEAFVQSIIDGVKTCQPDGEVQEIDAGDEALLVEVASGDTSTSVAVIRGGADVSTFYALYPAAEGSPLTPELMTASGTALAG